MTEEREVTLPTPVITGDTVPRPRLSPWVLMALGVSLSVVLVLMSPLGGQSYTGLLCVTLTLLGCLLAALAWKGIADSAGRLCGRRLAAVTLVLNLGVIAILLLAGVAHTSAAKGLCYSNQLEINMALIMYQQDYGRLPADWDTVRRYTDAKMPQDREKRWSCPGRNWLSPQPARGGYGLNAALAGQSLYTAADPNTLLLTADARTTNGMIATPADIAMTRHGNGCWASFADGTMHRMIPNTPIRLAP